jgi:hypothetical protein
MIDVRDDREVSDVLASLPRADVVQDQGVFAELNGFVKE